MSVFCEFISVIIRRDSIDKYFQGGWLRFVIDAQRGPMCCDGEIVNVGFMNPNDVQKYLDYLVNKGLQYEQSSNDPSLIRIIDDIIVLDRINGYHEKANWLEYGNRKFDGEEYFCCWMKRSAVDTLAFPFIFREGNFIRKMSSSIKPSEFKRFKFVRTENDLDIYFDSESAFKAECFMPHGMSIEDYYVQLKPDRERDEAKTKAMVEEQKAKQRELDKTQEKRLVEKKKVEHKLNEKIAKALKNKTFEKNNPMQVMEKLIEHALRTNNESDIDLIDEFWHDTGLFGFLDFEAGDNYYASVDAHEIIRRMKFEWEHYGDEESERDEMSEEDLFNTFKNAIEYEFEGYGARYVKQIGKYVISAYISDLREGRFTDFMVHYNAKELDDWYKNSGKFYFDSGDKSNYDDKILRAFFDEHY